MHPKLGISWEGFALEEVVRFLKAEEEDFYFWSTQSGAALDLLIIKDGKKQAFEFKFIDHPRITKSMHIAMEDLKLDSLTVIILHEAKFMLSEEISVIGLRTFIRPLSKL